MKRREFVQASAAAAAGMVFVKAGSVFGAPANDAIALGIIGCGGRGNAVGKDLMTAGARIVALHDLFDDRLAETKDRFDKLAAEKGLPAIESSMLFKGPDAYHKLLAAPVDAVLITSPPYWHPDHFEAAVAAGKHVYLEKPASHVYREGPLLVRAAEKYGKVLQHGTQMRSSEVTARARELLRSGVIGEVRMAKAWNVQRHSHRKAAPDGAVPKGVHYDLWLGPAPKRRFNPNRFHGNWQWYRDYGNGDIGNDGAHDIDMA